MSGCVLVLLNRLPFPLGFHGAYHGGLHGAVSKIYTICARIFCVVPMGQAYVTYGATQGLPVLVFGVRFSIVYAHRSLRGGTRRFSLCDFEYRYEHGYFWHALTHILSQASID